MAEARGDTERKSQMLLAISASDAAELDVLHRDLTKLGELLGVRVKGVDTLALGAFTERRGYFLGPELSVEASLTGTTLPGTSNSN